jgi:hypothetical protein
MIYDQGLINARAKRLGFGRDVFEEDGYARFVHISNLLK